MKISTHFLRTTSVLLALVCGLLLFGTLYSEFDVIGTFIDQIKVGSDTLVAAIETNDVNSSDFLDPKTVKSKVPSSDVRTKKKTKGESSTPSGVVVRKETEISSSKEEAHVNVKALDMSTSTTRDSELMSGSKDKRVPRSTEEYSSVEEDLDKLITGNKRNYILKDLHMCKSAEIEFSDKTHFKIGYQCSEGEKYKNFGHKLLDYIVQNITAPMGRRPFPIPSNSTVLIIGNSHTRQMSETLLCQYSASVDSLVTQSVGTRKSDGKSDYFTAHFHNGATMISLTNNPVVYSKYWERLVEGMIGRPLSSLDAIVLGKFNNHEESIGTSFLKTVNQVAKQINVTIDFEHVKAPQLMDVAKVYHDPIVSVSMFAAYGRKQERIDRFTQQELLKKNRTNVHVISGRKYIDEIGLECGTDRFIGEGDCNEMSKRKKKNQSRQANDKHRCMGTLGGHPDLIAWDVVESIWQLVSAGSKDKLAEKARQRGRVRKRNKSVV